MGEGYGALQRGGGLLVREGWGKSDDSLCCICNTHIQICEGF